MKYIIVFLLSTGSIAVPLPNGVDCDTYYNILTEQGRITYEVTNTLLDMVVINGYTCNILKT
jgi:hypothetical protein|tara:strand:+ start:260 stop:445 length:186 start_codon:yes stop_codon:yes gene_type:complete